MDQFEALSRSMAELIRQGRLGTLVSVRLLDHTAADHGQVERNLARGIQAAWDWLGGTAEHVSAVGGVEAGQITILIRFDSGSTALVGAGTCGSTAPRLDAIVVGSKGISSWEPIEPEEVSDHARRADATPASPVRVLEIMKAVREALATGQSVSLRGATVEGPAAVPAPARGVEPGKPAPVSSSTREGSAGVRGPSAKPPFGTLLVAGGATHQEDYARALAADPRCRLLALADEPEASPRRKHWNEQLARELGIPVLPDLDTALARTDVSVVSICAEPERRARIILRCAEAGKHLYLDKPLAASADEARQLVAAIERAGVVNQMFSMVHTAFARRARQIVRSGRLGDVVAIHADLLFAKGPAGTSKLGAP